MRSLPLNFLKTLSLLLIFHFQLSGQNVGIGITSPSAKLHLQSTIQEYTSLDLGFESGTINPANTSGDYNWYITGTDGYNSAKSAKMPLLLVASKTATLKYAFDMTIGKEITVSFDIKYDDPSNMVNVSIYSDHFNYTPSTNSTWESYSTTFVSQSSSDVINFAVKANQNEAFPIFHIDNILITYEDGHVLKVEDGTEGEGLFLQSDAIGQTKWFDLRGEVDQKISDNFQDLEFDTNQNALGIENGNFVLISALKNENGKSLQLSQSEIIASPGISLHLPGSNSSWPTLHFDAINRTMDWGISNASAKGFMSTRWGSNNTASHSFSTAWGEQNVSSGGLSTSWGVNNIAMGSNSTAWGSNNTSSGQNSTSWGLFNEASEIYSTSFGNDNLSSGAMSTSWGEGNTGSGLRSTVWGLSNTASGSLSTIWGSGNTASVSYTSAWGQGNSATSNRSTAWGNSNEASGANSTSFGKNNVSSAINTTTYGEDNTATGANSSSSGDSNTSNGEASNSWGYNNAVESLKGTAWGSSNLVASTAENGTVCGAENVAKGVASFVSGLSNEANSYGEIAFGRFNDSPSGIATTWSSSNMLFSIGNGSSDTNRSNAFTVRKDGNVGINSNASSYILNIFDEFAATINVESASGDSRIFLLSFEKSQIKLGGGGLFFDIEYDVATNCFSLNDKLRIDGSNVGINKINPSFDLHLGSDDAAKPGSSSWTVSSDRRLKKDITEFTDGLDIISAIEPVWFTYNGLADLPEETYVGTIAQDLEEIAPYMVTEYTHRDDEGNSENYKAVNYGAMDFVLINAIKELQQENIELKAQLTEILSLLNAEKD